MAEKFEKFDRFDCIACDMFIVQGSYLRTQARRNIFFFKNKMKQYFLWIMILCFMKGVSLFSQTTAVLKFNPCFGLSKLSNDSTYKLSANDSIQITAFKFYISNVELLNNNKSVWKDAVQFHLMDAFIEKSLVVIIPTDILYTKLKFNLGIDSTTNVSGAMGGDLDPTKGMYWTWQSGYINFKLEGTSNICKTRHNEFQFHLGGYQYPYTNLQTVFTDVGSKKDVERA